MRTAFQQTNSSKAEINREERREHIQKANRRPLYGRHRREQVINLKDINGFPTGKTKVIYHEA